MNRSGIINVVSLLIILVLALVAITMTTAAPIFSDNFESGNINGWTSSYVESGNVLEVIPAAAQEGTYGLHVVGGGTNDDAQAKKSITGISEIWTRVMMKLTQNVGEGSHVQLMVADSTSSLDGGIGAFSIRTKASEGYTNRAYTYGAGSFVSASNFQFTPGVWYCVELNVKRSSTAGAVRLWVDGVQIANRTGLNTGSTNIAWLGLGINGPRSTTNFYFDDFRSDNAAQIGCGAPPPTTTSTLATTTTTLAATTTTLATTSTTTSTTSTTLATTTTTLATSTTTTTIGPTTTSTTTTTLATTTTTIPSGSVVLTRYPYIQSCTTNSVIIAWKTDVGSDSTVEYGLTSSYGSSKNDPTSVVQHAVQLTDLLPGKEYYYRIKSNGQVLASEIFKTNKDESNPYFSFIGFGDSGEFSLQQQQLAVIMDSLNPDFLIHGGDVVYPSGEAGYYDLKYFSIYKNTIKNVCMFPSLGNHDVRAPGGQPYLDAFYLPVNNVTGTEKYYSYDYANAHFVVIDSNMDSDKSSFYSPEALAMKEWVRNDLASTTKPWKFAYFHHAPYSGGMNHFSDMRMRNEFSPIFEEYNVDVVFTAHEHNYQRSTPRKDYVPTSNGVVYIVSGGGGGGLYGAPPVGGFTAASAFKHHVTRLAIYNDTLVLHAIDTQGNIFDTYTINKGQADATAPIITQANASPVTSIDATINWQTDDLSNSKVEYGTTAALGSTATDLIQLTSYASSHSVKLKNLGLGTTYYYRVVSCNLNNICANSDIQSFTTLNPAVTTLSTTDLGDTVVDSTLPTTDYGTATQLHFGQDGTKQLGLFMKWDTSSIPSAATIRKATLQLYVADQYMEAADTWRVNFHHVYAYPSYSIAGQEWFEGNSNGGACAGNELCWATRPTTSAQMNLNALNSLDLTAPATGAFLNFDVTNVVQEAVSMAEPSATISVSVEKLTTDGGLDQVSFRSKEIGGSLVPKLTIEYYIG